MGCPLVPPQLRLTELSEEQTHPGSAVVAEEQPWVRTLGALAQRCLWGDWLM